MEKDKSDVADMKRKIFLIFREAPYKDQAENGRQFSATLAKKYGHNK